MVCGRPAGCEIAEEISPSDPFICSNRLKISSNQLKILFSDVISKCSKIVTIFFGGPPPLFLAIFTKLQICIKSQLEVVATFPERFWKAEGPYFSKIKFASTKLQFFTPFRNQKCIIQKLSEIGLENACIPFG